MGEELRAKDEGYGGLTGLPLAGEGVLIPWKSGMSGGRFAGLMWLSTVVTSSLESESESEGTIQRADILGPGAAGLDPAGRWGDICTGVRSRGTGDDRPGKGEERPGIGEDRPNPWGGSKRAGRDGVPPSPLSFPLA